MLKKLRKTRSKVKYLKIVDGRDEDWHTEILYYAITNYHH